MGEPDASVGPSSLAAQPVQTPICTKCGKAAVQSFAGPGRFICYRNVHALGIPSHWLIPTCKACNTVVLDETLRHELAAPLEKEYRRSLQRHVQCVLEVLSKTTSQRKLEKLLGLSQGYLSRLRAGAGTPSILMISHLALIALDPATHLKQLSRYWAAPVENFDFEKIYDAHTNPMPKEESP